MEPLSLLAGGLLLATGFLAGRLGARRARRAQTPEAPLAVCGCGHSLSQHDPKAATCHAEVARPAYDRKGRWAGNDWVACRCRQYIGPRPIEEVFAPRLLPPQA